MQSPGFIIEPYTRREPIAFWRRLVIDILSLSYYFIYTKDI